MRARGTGPMTGTPMGDWQHFAHGADIGVRGRGATPAEAFAQGATALTAVVTDPGRVAAGTTVRMHCQAPDLEMLFFEWLNTLVYHMATRRMLFSGFDVRIEDGRLEADAHGEAVDVQRHAPAVEVKGATLTELGVRQGPGGRWEAQCVIDV